MNERILVVDDEKAIADLVGIYLTKEGFDVQIAYSGADAAKAILEQEFDLALLDVMLPDIDGFELLAHHPALAHTYPRYYADSARCPTGQDRGPFAWRGRLRG